jgi:hypothetical protein
MKLLPAVSLAIVASLLVFPLRADNALQNGDFSDGISHWHGDARSPADFASDNPMAASDPFTSKGMIIPLKHSMWTTVSQDFKVTNPSSSLAITYMTSTDAAFSTKEEDYAEVPHSFGIDFFQVAKKTVTNVWYAVIYPTEGDAPKESIGGMMAFTPPTSHGQPSTVTVKDVKRVTPGLGYTLTLAFPPGTGTVVILNASIQ